MATAFVVAAGGCTDGGPTAIRDVGTETRSVNVLGASREYRLFAPETAIGIDGSPLLLLFHGATQGAAGVELMSWVYPDAEAAGLLVGYPEASGDYWNTPNSPPRFWNVADVQFVDAVVDDIDARHPVDRDRVYVAGFSNGAIFAEVLACLRGGQVAGLAIVGAGMSLDVARSCPWERPIPTVAYFGDADPQFFWDDGLAAAVGMLGGGGTAEWLADSNGCDPDPIVDERDAVEGDGTSLRTSRYVGCADDADVEFHRIVGGGHTWPGSPLNLGPGFGRKSRELDASRTMVDFLLRHALPASPR